MVEKISIVQLYNYSSDETHWFVGNKLLPNSKFPLVFDSVDGECKQEFGGTSYFNELEIEKVIDWIQKLIHTEWNGRKICPNDIGIISPYKKQCNSIQEDLNNKGINGISVGTAEIFQGQERRIIIISTVRSNELGFVSNKQVRRSKVSIFSYMFAIAMSFLSFQRLNVMVIRAICLLIVVGNHEALKSDHIWEELIEHCIKNAARI